MTRTSISNGSGFWISKKIGIKYAISVQICSYLYTEICGMNPLPWKSAFLNVNVFHFVTSFLTAICSSFSCDFFTIFVPKLIAAHIDVWVKRKCDIDCLKEWINLALVAVSFETQLSCVYVCRVGRSVCRGGITWLSPQFPIYGYKTRLSGGRNYGASDVP